MEPVVFLFSTDLLLLVLICGKLTAPDLVPIFGEISSVICFLWPFLCCLFLGLRIISSGGVDVVTVSSLAATGDSKETMCSILLDYLASSVWEGLSDKALYLTLGFSSMLLNCLSLCFLEDCAPEGLFLMLCMLWFLLRLYR